MPQETAGITRRQMLQGTVIAGLSGPGSPAPLDVPILCVVNKHAKCGAEQLKRFRVKVWLEAFRDFAACGMKLRVVERSGEVLKYPSGRPKFVGLERGKINLVLTDYVPVNWDKARYSAGVATIYDGYHVCVISMNRAHGHQAPFVAVNTVVHELLHMLLQDIFVPREGVLQSQGRESRVDWYATRMWLFNEGTVVRESAREYLRRVGAAGNVAG